MRKIRRMVRRHSYRPGGKPARASLEILVLAAVWLPSLFVIAAFVTWFFLGIRSRGFNCVKYG